MAKDFYDTILNLRSTRCWVKMDVSGVGSCEVSIEDGRPSNQFSASDTPDKPTLTAPADDAPPHQDQVEEVSGGLGDLERRAVSDIVKRQREEAERDVGTEKPVGGK